MTAHAIYYFRHGETVWNRLQRLQGREDSPLTLWGTQLSSDYGSRLLRELDGERDIEIVASPMGRTRQTAALIADVIGFDADAIAVDERLAEHDVGAWAGHSWGEISARFGVDPASRADWELRAPGGESRREMLHRAEAWLREPRAHAVTILVSHGGFSRVLRGAYLGLAPDEIGRLSTHTHGTFYRWVEGQCEVIIAHEAQASPEDLLG
jgi:broad specificity phosphatase PhoE